MRSHADRRGRLVGRGIALALALAAACPVSPALADMDHELGLFAADAHLSGQQDELSIPIEVPAALPMREAVLRLVYSNALAIQPERSSLDVALNGTPLARLPLTATQGPSTVEVVIPPGAFEVGRNRLTLRARQEHRLACDRTAYEELWTKIDHERTGLAFDLAPAIASIAPQSIDGLLGASLYDGEPLTVATARPPSAPTALAWGMAVSEAVALRRGERALPVRAARLATYASADSEPVDLATHAGSNVAVIGTIDELGDTLTADERATLAAGGVVARRLPADPVHVGLIVTGADDAAVEHALERFRGFEPAGREVPLLAGAASPSFADLGVATRELPIGQVPSMRVGFALPPTFYAGPGQNIRLYLNYAYAAGLSPTSAMLVRVNGNSANMIRLDRANGAVVTGRDILLSMEFLRPGLNTIELQPVLQLAEGAACPGDRPMLSLFDDSRIELPAFAEVSWGGDLRAFSSAAFPYAGIPQREARMVVLGEDPATVSAAWSLRGRMAQANRGPLPGLEALRVLPDNPSDSLLLVGTVGDLPEALRGTLALPWLRTAATPQHKAEETAASDGTPAAPAGSATASARARWQQRLQSERGPESDSLLGKLLGSLTSKASARQTATAPAPQPAEATAEVTAGLLAMRSPYRADRQLTLLTAETASALAEGTDLLLQPAVWDRLDGDYARWHGAAAAPVTQRLDERFLIDEIEPEPGQLRLAALTFLSSQRSLWIGLLLACLVLLSLGTSWALRRPQHS